MIRIGIICPSDIALRRFMPSLQLNKEMEYVGVGVHSSREKAQAFVDAYGGIIFDDYESVVTSDLVDAVYIPLPPALHYEWAKKALKNGKHVLLEKPFTTSLKQTEELIALAKEKNLAIHENYMFAYHKQIEAINEIIASGAIGEPRLYNVSFGFPMRQANDFRYNKALGGGALLDAGGYTIKYGSLLLGETAEVAYGSVSGLDGFEVDMYGSGAMVNKDGLTAQLAFGMDNGYRCELRVWGSKGEFKTGRVLTAPPNVEPTYTITINNEVTEGTLPSDDAFLHSIEMFVSAVKDDAVRQNQYEVVLTQSKHLNSFMIKAGVIHE